MGLVLQGRHDVDVGLSAHDAGHGSHFGAGQIVYRQVAVVIAQAERHLEAVGEVQCRLVEEAQVVGGRAEKTGYRAKGYIQLDASRALDCGLGLLPCLLGGDAGAHEPRRH